MAVVRGMEGDLFVQRLAIEQYQMLREVVFRRQVRGLRTKVQPDEVPLPHRDGCEQSL